MAKHYKSFREIDKELEILRLERTVHKLKAKQAVHEVKSFFTVSNLVKSLLKKFF